MIAPVAPRPGNGGIVPPWLREPITLPIMPTPPVTNTVPAASRMTPFPISEKRGENETGTA